MPWKENDDKSLVRDDKGNPIWLNDSGEEKGVDYPAMSTALGTANREAAERKAKLRDAESRLDHFKDIEDLPGYRQEADKAMEIVKALPDKDKAFEERIRAQVEATARPLKEQLEQEKKTNHDLSSRLHHEVIGNAFSRSAFVRDKMVDPVVAADLFSKHFSLNQDGRLVATGPDGQVLYGESGEAGFDEALAKLVDVYPGKSYLLKGSGASGSGAAPGGNYRTPTINPWKPESKNVTEQHRLAKENPELARSLAKEAGIVLPI